MSKHTSLSLFWMFTLRLMAGIRRSRLMQSVNIEVLKTWSNDLEKQQPQRQRLGWWLISMIITVSKHLKTWLNTCVLMRHEWSDFMSSTMWCVAMQAQPQVTFGTPLQLKVVLCKSVIQHPLNTSILIGWMLHLTVLALGGTKTGPTLYRIRWRWWEQSSCLRGLWIQFQILKLWKLVTSISEYLSPD